jgi:hypothetical protein
MSWVFVFFCLGFFAFNIEKNECCFIENVGGVDEDVLSIAFSEIQSLLVSNVKSVHYNLATCLMLLFHNL